MSGDMDEGGTGYDPSSEGAQMAFDGRMSCGDYLKRMLAVELFPELWHVRTEL